MFLLEGTTSQLSLKNKLICKLFITVNATIFLANLTSANAQSTTSALSSVRLLSITSQSSEIGHANSATESEQRTADERQWKLKQQQQQQQQQQQHNFEREKSARSITTSAQETTAAAPRTQQATTSDGVESSALVYLQRFGYMQAPVGISNNHLISEESFSSAVSEFQQFAGLPETGHVDNQTLVMMQMPRCGNTDKPIGSAGVSGPTATINKFGQLERTSRRLKRYALQGSKWRRQELTYRISQYPTKFAGGRRHEVEQQIERAFAIWSQVAPIDFVVKREGRVHIDIRFASGDHGDGDAFDGPGNTLAHAYFPQYGGDAHFDDQEYWTVDSYAGTNIFQVAAHELGHSLGLGHSNVREALMAPFYQKYKPNFRLHLDDVLAIQALYGEKSLPSSSVESSAGSPSPSSSSSSSQTTTTTTATTSTLPTSTTTTTTPAPVNRRPAAGGAERRPPIYRGKKRPAFGRGGDADNGADTPTVTTNTPPTSERDNRSPVMPPDLSTNGIDSGSDEHAPDSTGSSPPDLCTDSALDAITRTEDGNTYAFKGDHYWLLTNEGLAKNYPQLIGVDWDGLPGNLDAALTWADGKTFFFKGNKYWRFRNRRRDLGYPKLISAGFAGIPDDLDAAFVWSGNGRTYFFKGTDYWRFDSKADPPVSLEYPRSIKVWLGVPSYINAAFKWENNVTYFFKGTQYYRFNDREFKVETRGRPAFPRQTAEWWFGCVNSNLAQRAIPNSAPQPQPQQLQLQLQLQQRRRQDNAPASTADRRQHVSRNYLNLNEFHSSALVRGDGPQPDYKRTFETGQQQQQQVDASLRRTNTPISSGDEWSFLAGLPDDQTRPMGTHISDSHSQNEPEPTGAGNGERELIGNHPPGERPTTTTRSEPLDANFFASINKRLGQQAQSSLDASSGESYLDGRIKLEQAFKLANPAASSASTSAIVLTAQTNGHYLASRLLIFICTLILLVTSTATTAATLSMRTRGSSKKVSSV